ncbi:armadillo/beta-catenin-like repeat protein, putative [Eimeria necatrix]|uniref:Armadillo/beta-catenin-like repeat protein, putative n=1 Tax=Eimeria necatrix TaxID=51315 RepID=U6N0U0_9EIME|nr:armadillo/beta-catenin-like repeat protein, putative [Eimeria necatrix]CDJ68389.1 armadillo/beta-catenin-like repeat protein, putative [Eimeria necatrix]
MSRTLNQVFEEFQRARSHFVQTLADLTQRPQNIDGLRAAGALRLLRPLLLDSVPGIQQTAAVAVGRLAGHSEEAARECVNEEILPHLVASVAEQNAVVEAEAMPKTLHCLKDPDDLVRNLLCMLILGAIAALVDLIQETTGPTRLMSDFLSPESSDELKAKAKRALKKIRESEAASEVLDSIQSVCNLYPPEVVNYYSPGYSAILIEKIDAQA